METNTNTNNQAAGEITEEIAALCAARPDVAPFAYTVGAWVWVEFPTKPEKDTIAFLKGAGFRWNKDRACWQHNCGVHRAMWREGDPRAYYGMRAINHDDTRALAIR